MRYLGNKEALSPRIRQLLFDKGLLKRNLVFFDAFCGTGSVAYALSNDFDKIIINDILSCCVTYSRGRLVGNECSFENLGFNPFMYLNSTKEELQGFFYTNYSPGGSRRMYFSEENAGRIDFFRFTIEKWFKDKAISEDEYVYLLACLIESVSKVSNTAGVFGAYLKHWDQRALKPIQFVSIPSNTLLKGASIESHCNRIENIIDKIDCDILYLDPPYTQNQYGTQYHILETLVKNDNPTLSAITGSRPTSPMRSEWSKNHKCHILLDKTIAETKAKYIMLSYNNDGLMSKDFIEATMKRYAKKDTYECIEIGYKKYNNFKCQGSDGHVEYLFFIEKDASGTVYESPLNYTGSKTKMVTDIKSMLPDRIGTFVDVFGGGFNVGINIEADRIVYNDINPFVVELMKSFAINDSYEYLEFVFSLINKYDLKPNNKDSYHKLRELYNQDKEAERDSRMLYTLILYGFQQQIRFNSSHQFNNPCGSRHFNDFLLSKFISFARISKKKSDKIEYENKDFIPIIQLSDSDKFLYLDPPYLSTTGAYNDGKRGFQGWTITHERTMRNLLDSASKRGVKFLLSYILENKDFHNLEIREWVASNKYSLTEVASPQGKYNNRKEVLIYNY